MEAFDLPFDNLRAVEKSFFCCCVHIFILYPMGVLCNASMLTLYTENMEIIIIIGVGILVYWVSKLVRLFRSIDRYAAYWRQRQKQSGELVYVALGDSAAQGIGASKPQKGYVALIVDALQQKTGKRVRVINLSKTGATIRDLIEEQLPLLRQYDADVVTVAIGGNDIKVFDKERYRQDSEELMEALPEGTYIADAPYFMHGGWEKHAIEMRDITRAAALRHKMQIVPLYEHMFREGWKAMWNHYAADWFHPNDRGYRVWFTSFWQQIDTKVL